MEATVGRRRTKDSAPDLRGRLSRICGFGGFLPRAVSGAFSQPRISNVPVGRFILTA